MITENYRDFSDFEGFQTVAYYRENLHQIPKLPGVYVLARVKKEGPQFLAIGSGGHFKDREPNVSLNELGANWVEGASVVYIGKAGSRTGSATLRDRIDQLLKFGEGRKIGHWGGRLLWQLADHEELLLGWMVISDRKPSDVESELINEFKSHFGCRPFANLQG
jgi:hypothetical protein